MGKGSRQLPLASQVVKRPSHSPARGCLPQQQKPGPFYGDAAEALCGPAAI